MPSSSRGIEELIVDTLRWMDNLGQPVAEHAVIARFGRADANRVLKLLIEHQCVEYDLVFAIDSEGIEHAAPRGLLRLTTKGVERAQSFRR